ncbi:MAG: leucine--tRNA ligase [Phycisphaeraceae bacterium]|nr:leucine--tRNA ligase [Phycisphaeraceae bacterium]
MTSNAPKPSPAHANTAATDESTPFRYDARLADQIEQRWQTYWDDHKTFETPNPGDPGFDHSKPKHYVLDMFPYPSGAGLHVGHPEGYTASDIVARFMRMKGFNVLHPMGWDAFGLPAEQYAIQTGIHPAKTTRDAIDTFRRQLKRFGFSYDWSREVGTIDPDYYRWTQWIFLRAYDAWYDPWQDKARPIADLVRELESGDLRIDLSGDPVHIGLSAKTSALGGEPVGTRRWHELTPEQRRTVIDNQRLAYVGQTSVNWCPALGTVLANDEVTADGLSERGGHPVSKKPLRQWMFRITAYAERLLNDLDSLDWPESTKTMQREWIGRSEGAEIDFDLADPVSGTPFLRVFTTRPDTVFGATFMVVAPEHPIVSAALGMKSHAPNAHALRAYVEAARNRSDVERQESKSKTGVFTGLHAVNPATGDKVPIWTADYVLMNYGHGAIMAVPAHDERDFEFARAHNLPIRDVVHTRTHAVMAYYALHARPDESSSDAWKTVLADFLGLSTTASAGPDIFAGVLDAVRRRRAEPQPPAPSEHADADSAQSKEPQTARGAIQADWLAAIEGMGFANFDDLRTRFDSASVFDFIGAAYSGLGYACNSTNDRVSLDGLATPDAKARIIAWLESEGLGFGKVNYRLRDWAFSRQRYWGEPFPIVFDEHGNHYPVSESALPVTLPVLADYAPIESDDPMPLLAKAADWLDTTAGQAGVDPAILDPSTPVRREANTMPGSAGSSWYFLRYCDPRNTERFISKEADAYWMRGNANPTGGHATGGVDLYIGGAEHAVGHLLYARFWQKVLFDLGEVSTPEPFAKLFHQGLITSFAYQRKNKTLVPVDQVEEVSEGVFKEKATGEPLTPITAKMSKSLKNVVNPDDIIADYGADTFRLYEMYMGPLEASKPWNTKDTVGLHRFLQRAWRLAVDERTGELKLRDPQPPDAKVEKHLHRTIDKVTTDIPRLALNTAIAALIEFVNTATAAATTAGTNGNSGGGGGGGGGLTRDQLARFALILAPFAPHVAEELWARLGHSGSLAYHPFPEADPAMLRDDAVEIAVQINGKVRAKLQVPTNADRAAVEHQVMSDESVLSLLNGQKPKKVVVVPGKLVNIVL